MKNFYRRRDLILSMLLVAQIQTSLNIRLVTEINRLTVMDDRYHDLLFNFLFSPTTLMPETYMERHHWQPKQLALTEVIQYPTSEQV